LLTATPLALGTTCDDMRPQDSPSKFLGFGIVVGVVIPYLATDALISVRLSAPPPAP
jgi:hypothetical protein